MADPLNDYLTLHFKQVNDRLSQAFNQLETVSSRVQEAMRYSLFADGKRLRPILAYAGADAVGEINPLVDATACALECIHTYSLIHDDLPAMDDDELRRGVPTCHIAFDEPTAILAGDALQTLAFQLLADSDLGAPAIQVALIRRLSHAAGAAGMVGGQTLDLAAVGQQPSLDELETIHRYKTGALIQASVAMGAMAAGAGEEDLTALERYGQAIGLAFQVQDDILDVNGNTETLGKQSGADARLGKPTYVSLLGMKAAQERTWHLHREAMAALADLDARAQPLRDLSSYIVERVA